MAGVLIKVAPKGSGTIVLSGQLKVVDVSVNLMDGVHHQCPLPRRHPTVNHPHTVCLQGFVLDNIEKLL